MLPHFTQCHFSPLHLTQLLFTELRLIRLLFANVSVDEAHSILLWSVTHLKRVSNTLHLYITNSNVSIESCSPIPSDTTITEEKLLHSTSLLFLPDPEHLRHRLQVLLGWGNLWLSNWCIFQAACCRQVQPLHNGYAVWCNDMLREYLWRKCQLRYNWRTTIRCWRYTIQATKPAREKRIDCEFC